MIAVKLLDEAIIQLDNVVEVVQTAIGDQTANSMNIQEGIQLSLTKHCESVSHSNCKNCNYVLTLPFERKCPVCGFLGKRPEFKLDLKPQTLKKQPSKAAKKSGAGSSNARQSATADTFKMADIRICEVSDVNPHPEADSLYICKIQTGGEERQLCAGIRRWYGPEELKGRKIVSILNLGAKKLRGVESNAMLLAGSQGEGDDLIVKALEPPSDSKVGDRIYVTGEKPGSPSKKISNKNWAKIVEVLNVKNGKATFNSTPILCNAGVISCSLADGSGIH